MDSPDIALFFTQLTQAFINSDIAKMRDMHASRSSFSSPDTIKLANSEQDFIDTFTQGADLLMRENISGVSVSNGQWQELTSNLIIASLDWRLFDQSNNLFTEFRAIYHLTIIGSAFKICSTQSVEMHTNVEMQNRFTISQE